MNPAGLLAELGFVAISVVVLRRGRRANARARRRDVFYGNTRGHDHEAWR